jgi:hypothetical protein
VNNSVTSRVKRYGVRYRTVIGGSDVIAREFPHMVSCRSHLTYFVFSNCFFFVFCHPFFPSALLQTFLSLFLSFLLSFFLLSFLLSFFLPFFLYFFIPSFPVLLLLLLTDAVFQRAAPITYFRPPLHIHDCLLPTSPSESRLLISNLLYSYKIADFRPPLQPHDCLLLPSSLPTIHPVI